MNEQLSYLIKENEKLIYKITHFFTNYESKEDLFQVGCIGLIKAYQNYKEGYNTKFTTYAYPYILGAISNYVRENKQLKISRDLIRLGKKINEYIDKHLEVRGYKPSICDISMMLGIKEEKIINALDACQSTKRLNEEIESDGKVITLLDMTSKEDKISKESLIDLKEAFKSLSDDEKRLIINRYYKDYTQSEVAQILGVNQVYVSRMESKALTKMREKMIA